MLDPMDLVVKVTAEAASAVAIASAEGKPLSAVLGLAVPLGITLVPMHPGASDAETGSWFIAENVATTDDVLALLRGSPMVEAAYTKPGAEFPS